MIGEGKERTCERVDENKMSLLLGPLLCHPFRSVLHNVNPPPFPPGSSPMSFLGSFPGSFLLRLSSTTSSVPHTPRGKGEGKKDDSVKEGDEVRVCSDLDRSSQPLTGYRRRV